MGSSRALACRTAFVLVLLSSASTDGDLPEQRDITFDLGTIMQEMQQPDSIMMQKEVDLSHYFNPKEFPIQQELIPVPEQYEAPNERGRSGFRPHLSAGPPMTDYPVQFPLARPSRNNLMAICIHSDHRPRYPNSYFPASGFGQQKRRASAVNTAESWFSTCCQGNEMWGREATLCCAIQAWELSVQSFCQEDSSVKDRLYSCCRKEGRDRLNCFHKDAPNPNYGPTEVLPVPPVPSGANFNFEPSTCQRGTLTTKSQRLQMTPKSLKGNKGKKVKTLSTSQKIDINFPPGRPTADNIESICQNQKLRPLYSVKCLPRSDYEWLTRQAKTINRIEKGFKQCCKKKMGMLSCADRKWLEEFKKFCTGENGEQVDFHCCSAGDGENDQYKCFQDISPDPHYNMTSTNEELSLSKLCDTHKIIKNKFPVGFPLKNFVTHCCPLPEQHQSSCFQERLKETSEKLCLAKKVSPPAVRRCCRAPTQDSLQCISKILMDAVTKANSFLHQKKRKRCPLS